jgi:hypothetical protein
VIRRTWAGSAESASTPRAAGLRRSLTSGAIPIAALLLAILALVAAYLTSLRSSPGQSILPTTGALGHAAYPPPTLNGAFTAEPGPNGQEWQWVGETASVDLAGPGWLAFQALSLGVARTLIFRGPVGEVASTQIGTKPELHLVGPLSGGVSMLSSKPGGAVASRRDARRLSVWLSTLRISQQPLAAAPTSGFWPTETLGDVAFNWLAGTGAVDVYAGKPGVARIWLTLLARSMGSQRTLVGQSGASISEALVTTSPHLARLGPFPLSRGRARILLSTSPGPNHYGNDQRLLSVQVARLAVHTSPSEA